MKQGSSLNVITGSTANHTDLNKAIKKLKEEYIPKRIERAIETFEDKLKLIHVQTKNQLSKKIDPLEHKIDNNKKEIAKLNQILVQIKY